MKLRLLATALAGVLMIMQPADERDPLVGEWIGSFGSSRFPSPATTRELKIEFRDGRIIEYSNQFGDGNWRYVKVWKYRIDTTMSPMRIDLLPLSEEGDRRSDQESKLDLLALKGIGELRDGGARLYICYARSSADPRVKNFEGGEGTNYLIWDLVRVKSPKDIPE